MKNVRLFYTKTGRMKFLSQLDMNRLMTRVIRKSGLPVWYTEGFNQHIYINYAVPLSLGFEGLYEIMDIRITDDEITPENIVKQLNSAAPDGIEFLRAAEPVKPTVEIAFAGDELIFPDEDAGIYKDLREFLSQESVVCLKKDKKGRMKEFDIIPKIKKTEITENGARLILTAGNEGNLNPSLLLSAILSRIDEICLPRNIEMIAGGASLAPRRWALVAVEMAAFRAPLCL